MIESHSFGRMTIDGTNYRSDLIIFPDSRVEDGWRRRRGHWLTPEDISELISEAPDTLVVGTGVTGMMRISSDLEGLLRELNINLIAMRNGKAVKHYNDMQGRGNVGACFHLTC